MKTAATVALRSVPRAALALPPAWRRGMALVLVALACLAGLYVAWFRDSSFARVKKVEITGLSGPQARAIRSSLVTAGLGQTTLHVDGRRLRDAVSGYPVVRSVTATGDFPHLLRIEVELNLPVAALQVGGARFPVAADGLMLRDVPLAPGLPTLKASGIVAGTRVESGPAAQLLQVVAAAPEAIRTRIKSVERKASTGLVAHMRRGPDLIFGDTTRLAAKWIAAVRVLSSLSAKGATYIDLRLPERPAAGGLSTTGVIPLAPAGTDPAETAPPATTTPAPAAPGSTGATPGSTGTTTTPAQTTATAPTTTTTTQTPTQTQQPAQAAPAPATSGGGLEAPE